MAVVGGMSLGGCGGRGLLGGCGGGGLLGGCGGGGLLGGCGGGGLLGGCGGGGLLGGRGGLGKGGHSGFGKRRCGGDSWFVSLGDYSHFGRWENMHSGGDHTDGCGDGRRGFNGIHVTTGRARAVFIFSQVHDDPGL